MQTVIYTDGACKGNGKDGGGLGGWGFCWEQDGRFVGQCGGALDVTNNIMELKAALEAMRYVLGAGIMNVKFVSDSQYVINGLTSWLKGWKQKNWKTAQGKPVMNKELWQALDATQQALLDRGATVVWEWVRGHDGHPGNEMADQLANKGAEGTQGTVELGSVAPEADVSQPRVVGGVNVSEWHANGSDGQYYDFEREMISFEDEGNSSVDLRLTFNAADRTAYLVLLRRNNDGNTRELGDEIQMTWAHARALICDRPDLLERLPFEEAEPDMTKPFEALLMGVPEHLMKESWVKNAVAAMNALRQAQ